MTRNTRQIVLVALIAAVAGFGLAALIWSLGSGPSSQQQQAQATDAGAQQQRVGTDENANTNAGANANTRQRGADEERGVEAKDKDKSRAGGNENRAEGNDRGNSITDAIGFGQGAAFAPHESWTITVPRILLRLLLATLLASLLAFRPRRSAPLVQRNLYVAQTQILLAVVASALMMTVGDNAARAFGIFAAASLVRFRTNIRDPKEITVLLVNLALGLATGVGRIDVGVVLALFVLLLLWLLERREEEQVFRAMELTVKTRDTERTRAALQRIFARRGIDGEVRQINPPSEDEPVGCVMYYVNMSLKTSTDAVNREIMEADPEAVESIEWEQQKNRDYIYQ